MPKLWRVVKSGHVATAFDGIAAQRFGDAWIDSRRALALAVPSAIVPEERNYVLNPEHKRFAALRFGRALPLLLDPRLVG